MEDENAQNSRRTKALIAAVEALSEYFDSIQIFVTKNKSEEMTEAQTYGKGNIYARFGQIDLWVDKVRTHLGMDDSEEPINGDEGDEDDNKGF